MDHPILKPDNSIFFQKFPFKNSIMIQFIFFNFKTTQKFGRVRAVPRLCGSYPGICLTTEEKARKNLSQGSQT